MSMGQTASMMRIPETMGAADIGPYLRELREYFKLTPLDVSERLRIRVRYILAMEEGRYSDLPGMVYARGYLHTYAEFLGLDANQVVVQCMPKDAASAQVIQATFSRNTPVYGAPKTRRNGWVWVVGLLMVAGVFYTQFGRNRSFDDLTVEVPPALLARVQEEVMPTARNAACLGMATPLGCFFAQPNTQVLGKLPAMPMAPEFDRANALMSAEEIAAQKAAEAEAFEGDVPGSQAEEEPPHESTH